MRIAAHPAHTVATDAIRTRSLIVAGGTTADVAACGVAVEIARAGEAPTGGMRIVAARPAGRRDEPFVAMTRFAEARAVAAPAGHLIGGGLERVAPQEIVAVNELR